MACSKDSAWSLANPYDSFVEIDPQQGAIPKQYTAAQVLYNKHFLYIGAFSRVSLGKKIHGRPQRGLRSISTTTCIL